VDNLSVEFTVRSLGLPMKSSARAILTIII
jgi:hypothetical protein